MTAWRRAVAAVALSPSTGGSSMVKAVSIWLRQRASRLSRPMLPASARAARKTMKPMMAGRKKPAASRSRGRSLRSRLMGRPLMGQPQAHRRM